MNAMWIIYEIQIYMLSGKLCVWIKKKQTKLINLMHI